MRRAATLVALLWPAGALACACCAERGERFAYDMALGDYEIAQIATLKADGPAHLFLTACGMACVQGVRDPQERYSVQLEAAPDALRFLLSDADGVARGSLSLTLPERFIYFGVDTEPLVQASGMTLYTEMRLPGRATGTGDFSGVEGAELVLSGPGNMCIGAKNLAHWRLELRGEGVDYRLFGGLTSR